MLDGVIQRRDKPDPATYIGSGKALELRDIVIAEGADTVVCDGQLSPGQRLDLEDVVKVKVVDRTALILDIFAQHAKSREGKAQVGIAQVRASYRACVAGVSRCRARPVARLPAARAWARADRVRPRSTSTVDGSTPASPSCAVRSRR